MENEIYNHKLKRGAGIGIFGMLFNYLEKYPNPLPANIRSRNRRRRKVKPIGTFPRKGSSRSKKTINRERIGSNDLFEENDTMYRDYDEDIENKKLEKLAEMKQEYFDNSIKMIKKMLLKVHIEHVAEYCKKEMYDIDTYNIELAEERMDYILNKMVFTLNKAFEYLVQPELYFKPIKLD